MRSGHTVDYFSSLKSAFDNPQLSGSQSDSEDSCSENAPSSPTLEQDLAERNVQAKFVLPKFWEGLWKPAQNVSLGEKLTQKQISIVSWNVFFGLRNRATRMEQMGKVIRDLQPDFIFLQEVTPESMKVITSQKWARHYYISDPEAQHVRTYGNVIFSKIRMAECAIKKLDSKLGRRLQLGLTHVHNAPPLLLGTFHLESSPEDSDIRQIQLSQISEATLFGACSVICGDTNFFSDTEASALGDHFKDAWEVLYQKSPEEKEANPGITFDTTNNIMCREEFQQRDDFVEKRLRLDRCFYTPETIEPVSMKLLGVEPYFREEWISDHFGLFIELRLK